MKSHLTFIEIAERDLKAAKTLFNKKLYPQSVFYLQQSIEKAVKSLGLWNKIITINDAKSYIGHDASKLYFKIFSELKNMLENFDEFCETLPELKLSLLKDQIINVLKERLNKYKKIFPDDTVAWDISFSDQDLESIISVINRQNEAFRKISKEEKKMIREGLKDAKNKLFEFLDVFYSKINSEKLKNVKDELNKIFSPGYIDGFLKSLINYVLKLLPCYISLYYLSLVFSVHSVKSRYSEEELNPLQVYNENMPLIQKLDSFIKITYETLRKLKQIYIKMPEPMW